MCSFDECGKPTKARGLCAGHYMQQRQGRELAPLRKRRSPKEPYPECPIDGCERDATHLGLCRAHWNQRRSGRPVGKLRTMSPKGSGTRKNGYRLSYRPDHPGASQAGYVMAHRLVMERELGRELLPGENVHHINGVRHDNRPENLELWVTSQPAGQRPEDLVEWAQEILRRYA